MLRIGCYFLSRRRQRVVVEVVKLKSILSHLTHIFKVEYLPCSSPEECEALLREMIWMVAGDVSDVFRQEDSPRIDEDQNKLATGLWPTGCIMLPISWRDPSTLSEKISSSATLPVKQTPSPSRKRQLRPWDQGGLLLTGGVAEMLKMIR